MNTNKIIAGALTSALAMTQVGSAFATEMLIYSNEVLEENANTLILDNDDTLGDVVLQFGGTLGEQLYWDESESVFTFTDDVNVQGDLTVDGDLNLASGVGVNSILDEDDMASDSATALATQQSIKAYVDNEITNSSDDTKADKVSGATAGNIAGLDANGNLTDSGVAANNVVTLDGAQTITGDKTLSGTTTINGDITGSSVNTDGTLATVSNTEVASSQAVKTYVDNIDGTDSDSFTVNQNGANASLEFGNTGDGVVTYENTTDTFDFNGQTITNVADPTNNQDVTTKGYVDGLVNGLTWKDPIEHANQLIDGAAGGIRAGGKIFIDNHTQILDGDTITVSYNGGLSTFVLTAKDAPTATSCEFASGATAGSATAVAQSIVTTIGSCASASDFMGQTVSEGAAVYLIHDDAGSIGNGLIATSGAGIVKIDMHEGKTHAEVLSAETRVSRASDATYTWDDDAEEWIQITGTGSVPYATTTSAGIVELAEDNESLAGLAVQANDSRLHTQNTDSSTDKESFTVDLGGNKGTIQILANDAANEYDLVINNSGMTNDITVTGADLEKLIDITSTAAEIDAAVGDSHDQNTDTGTDNATFRVNDATGAGYVELADNNGAYVLSINNNGISADLTVTAADLKKLVDIASTAAQIDDAVSKAHDQNTDTGTTADTFVLDTDDSATEVALQFGTAINETLSWDDTNSVFTFTDDVLVQGDLEVQGSLTLDSGVSTDAILDEDNMASNSATALATQQSIKAYVDNTVTGYSDDDKADKVSGATAGNIAGLDANGNLTDSGVAANNVVTLDGAQTITGDKTLSGTTTINGDITGSSVNTDGTLATVSNTEVASSQAVKTYVDNADGTRTYTEENYVTNGETLTDSIDALDQQVADVSALGHDQNTDTGTDADDFTVNTDGDDATLSMGQTGNGDITYTSGTDTFNMQGDLTVGSVNGADISNSGVDFNGNATVGTSSDTLALDSTNWSIDAAGNTTGLTIDADTNTIENLDWDDLATRTKKYHVTMQNMTVQAPSSNYFCDLYAGSEEQNAGNTNPHEYYLLKTRRPSLQSMGMMIKVKLPEDFVSFDGTNDLSFYFKNTGANSSESAISISVADNANNLAWVGSAGQDLYSATWTEFTAEFSNGLFTPAAGDYIYINVDGFASNNASPYIGEIVLTYIGK